MKTAISLLFLAITIYGQAKQDRSELKGTSLSFSTFFDPQTILWESPLEKEFNMMNLNTSFLNDTASIMIATRMQLANFYNKPFENSANNLLSPLYQTYLDSQKNKWIKEALGAVELGAVGILAYQHISKYGFLKKKD